MLAILHFQVVSRVLETCQLANIKTLLPAIWLVTISFRFQSP